MDKSWITLGKTADGRLSQQYSKGVMSFLNFAKAVGDKNGNIPCPCRNCVNFYRQTPRTVQVHLLLHGIIQSYTTWYEHGEPRVQEASRRQEESSKRQEEATTSIIESSKNQGFTGPFGSGGTSSASQNTSWLVLC